MNDPAPGDTQEEDLMEGLGMSAHRRNSKHRKDPSIAALLWSHPFESVPFGAWLGLIVGTFAVVAFLLIVFFG
jgi:hypothetical protein